MTSQSPHTYSRVAAAIVMAAIIIAAAIFTSSALYTTVTRTEATTTTSTVFIQPSVTTETSTSTTATTSCMVITGPAIGVVIQIVENTPGGGVSPIAGAQITGQAVGYCNNVHALNATTTNSSGWASLLDGQISHQYNLAITYVQPLGATLAFNMSIVTYTMAVTYATFNISTGNLTTHLCENNVQCTTH